MIHPPCHAAALRSESRSKQITIVKKTLGFLALMFLFSVQIGCNAETRSMESISIDFPHGETRLLVRRNGDAFLFYGAVPQSQKVKNGVFDIDELYKQLRTRLHNKVPREKWPNPDSRAGMVTVQFDSTAKKDYLIFDEAEFTERLFKKAKQNIVGHAP